MSGRYITGLKTARQTAGLTQEQAAEAAGVSLESWKAYEYGERLPPGNVAIRICDALDADWLALEYLRETAKDLDVLPKEIKAQSLQTAVITLINRMFSFMDNHQDRRLLAIAEDDDIDEHEQPEFDDIVKNDLDGIIAASLAVKYPKKQKEDRPVAGTTERSEVRTRIQTIA